MNASRRRLAASFNNSIPGSAVQRLLSASSDVSGSIPGDPSNVLNEIPMEEDRPDETQGLMHPEDFDSSTSGDGQSAPPGIPNPVMDQ